jgi:hypothetical protein
VDISLLPSSQTVWKALHPGQNAMTSVGSATYLLSPAPAALASLTAVKVIDVLPSQSNYPVSFILSGQSWKNHKMQAEKVTKICHLSESSISPQIPSVYITPVVISG